MGRSEVHMQSQRAHHKCTFSATSTPTLLSSPCPPQVERSAKALTHQDAFLYDNGKELYVFAGRSCSRIKKSKALEAAVRIKDHEYQKRVSLVVVEGTALRALLARCFCAKDRGSESKPSCDVNDVCVCAGDGSRGEGNSDLFWAELGGTLDDVNDASEDDAAFDARVEASTALYGYVVWRPMLCVLISCSRFRKT